MHRLVSSAALVLIAAAASGQESYSSLKDYCLRTGVDTPANCECGQQTADAIMTDEEQASALAMMAYQQQPQMSPEEQMALMTKLSQVTEGCGSSDQ